MGMVGWETVKGRIGTYGNALASLVFPDRCYLCGHLVDKPICPGCVAAFPLIEGHTCSKCGKPTAVPVGECKECRGRGFRFSSVISGGRYDGSLKQAIHILKYSNGKRLAGQLAQLLAAAVEQRSLNFDCITYVPMSWSKQANRGYNQAELIARELGKLLTAEPACLLMRASRARPQSELGMDERRKNVRGAFRSRKSVSGSILLVDDVYTTGSTVNECAKELKRAGASRVIVATVARTVLD